MDNNVQADKPEIKAEVAPPAEAEPITAPTTEAKPEAVIAALMVEAKAEAEKISAPPAPVIAPPPPAPVMPPAPPVPTVEPKRVNTSSLSASVAASVKVDEPKPAAVEQKKTDPSQRIAFVIEDDFDASEIFGKAMEANGLAFEVINTGNRAIERLGEVAPDIVVLDMHLPNVDGTQILAHIRKTERLAKTLVIVVTADARVGELVKADADLVVLKPATYTQVRDFASRLLRRHALS